MPDDLLSRIAQSLPDMRMEIRSRIGQRLKDGARIGVAEDGHVLEIAIDPQTGRRLRRVVARYGTTAGPLPKPGKPRIAGGEDSGSGRLIADRENQA